MEWILSSPLAFWSLFVSPPFFFSFFCLPLKLSLFSDRPNTDLTAPVPVLLSHPDSPTPSERECGCRWVKASSSRPLSSPSTPRPSARPTWQSWRTPWTCGESARYAASGTFQFRATSGHTKSSRQESKENPQTAFCYFSKNKRCYLFPSVIDCCWGGRHTPREVLREVLQNIIHHLIAASHWKAATKM